MQKLGRTRFRSYQYHRHRPGSGAVEPVGPRCQSVQLVQAVKSLTEVINKHFLLSVATGREGPGMAYRLYTEAAFTSLPAVTLAEIQRTNLTGVVLQLKAMGIDDVLGFDFMDPPPAAALLRAHELLCDLSRRWPGSSKSLWSRGHIACQQTTCTWLMQVCAWRVGLGRQACAASWLPDGQAAS